METRILFAAVALMSCSALGFAAQTPNFYVHEEEALGTVTAMGTPMGTALESGDFFGRCVAVSGDTLVVGASNHGAGDEGSVYIFTRSGLDWVFEHELVEGDEEFGECVAVSGDTIVVGAPGSDVAGLDAGTAYVYVFDGMNMWLPQGLPLSGNGVSERDHFGSSIAIDGDTIVVGARFADIGASSPDAGRVFIFERSGTTWSEHLNSPLEALDAAPFDEFGNSVAIYNSTIVVGAPREDAALTNDCGAIYVYERVGTDWIAGPKLLPAVRFPFAQFGDCVSIFDNRIAVGAPLGMRGADVSGSVSVFDRVASVWQHTQTFSASDSEDNDRFGDCLALFGDRLVVGAWNDSHQHLASGVDFLAVGSAYVFDLDGTNPFVEALRFCPSATLEHGRFGAAVSFDANRAVVGAWQANALAGDAFVFHIIDQIPRDFCFGDGGDQMGCTNCPCSNNADPLMMVVGGCLNSVGTSARLSASGDHSVTLPSGDMTDLRLALEGAPPNTLCILNSGAAVGNIVRTHPCFGLNSGTQAMVFDGLRCAVQDIRRHGGRSSDVNGMVGILTPPWGGEGGPPVGIAASMTADFAAGQTRYFQAIIRDDPLLNCMRALNTTQAIEITFAP